MGPHGAFGNVSLRNGVLAMDLVKTLRPWETLFGVNGVDVSVALQGTNIFCATGSKSKSHFFRKKGMGISTQ